MELLPVQETVSQCFFMSFRPAGEIFLNNNINILRFLACTRNDIYPDYGTVSKPAALNRNIPGNDKKRRGKTGMLSPALKTYKIKITPLENPAACRAGMMVPPFSANTGFNALCEPTR